MAYISRNYLREKYKALKWDMENVLRVLSETQEDSVDAEDVLKTLPNIRDKMESIIIELEKAKKD